MPDLDRHTTVTGLKIDGKQVYAIQIQLSTAQAGLKAGVTTN